MKLSGMRVNSPIILGLALIATIYLRHMGFFLENWLHCVNKIPCQGQGRMGEGRLVDGLVDGSEGWGSWTDRRDKLMTC